MIFILLIPALLIFSAGCSRQQMVTYEVENFELIRTVAVDKVDGQIKLTASTGVGLEDEPGKIYYAFGSSIAEAMENLRRSYTIGEAFFAYTEHIVIGSEAVDCLETVLDVVARSIDLRLGINIYIVQSGTAEELVTLCQGSETTLSDMLTSVVREVSRIGRGYIYTCGDVMSSLAKYGYALITVIAPSQSEEVWEGAPEYDVQTLGFAVVSEGKILGCTDEGATTGVLILNDLPCMQTIALGDVTVQVTDIDCKISSDDFQTINVAVTAQAGVIEDSGGVSLTDEQVRSELERALGTKLLQQVRCSLLLSQQYGVDFCAIGPALEKHSPTKFRDIDWQEHFENAVFNISIRANIQRTYDVSDTLELKGDNR